jgi:hypothetical protein
MSCWPPYYFWQLCSADVPADAGTIVSPAVILAVACCTLGVTDVVDSLAVAGILDVESVF